MARRVHNIDARLEIAFRPFDAGAFGQDRNAALALQIVGIQRALGDGLIVAKRTALLEQLVNKCRFAMINMCDDGNIPQVHGMESLYNT